MPLRSLSVGVLSKSRRHNRGLLHHFIVELGPIRYAAVHAPHVYEVKALFCIDPVAAGVINFELQIRWNFPWLCR